VQNRGQGGGVVGIDRRHGAAGKDVVVKNVKRLDGLAQIVRQPPVARPHAGEFGGPAVAGNLVGMEDGDQRRHLAERRVRMPQLVAGLVMGAAVAAILFRAVVAKLSIAGAGA